MADGHSHTNVLASQQWQSLAQWNLLHSSRTRSPGDTIYFLVLRSIKIGGAAEISPFCGIDPLREFVYWQVTSTGRRSEVRSTRLARAGAELDRIKLALLSPLERGGMIGPLRRVKLIVGYFPKVPYLSLPFMLWFLRTFLVLSRFFIFLNIATLYNLGSGKMLYISIIKLIKSELVIRTEKKNNLNKRESQHTFSNPNSSNKTV